MCIGTAENLVRRGPARKSRRPSLEELLTSAAEAARAAPNRAAKRRVRQRLHKKLGAMLTIEEFEQTMDRYQAMVEDAQAQSQDMAFWMTQMEVTQPEILRAVPAFQIVQCFGRVLRNGMAAFVAGTLSALVMMCLFCLDLLPGYFRRPFLGSDTEYKYGPWALFTGVVISALTLFFWRPKQAMFLDRICINQVDQAMKAEGVLNMGAILKHSDSMLVLWDTTFASRLWCLFEMAAFLKSHEDGLEHLRIKPTYLAPCTFVIAFCVMLMMLFELTVPFVNIYVVVMKLSLLALSCITAARLLFLYYGAEIVGECITEWFGSVDGFESSPGSVRSTVSKALSAQLGHFPCPYAWLLRATSPVLWAHFDMVAARIHSGDIEYAVAVAIHALAWWLALFPSSLFLVAVSYKCYERPRRGMLEFATFGLSLLAPVLSLAGGVGYMYVCLRVVENAIAGATLFAGTMLVPAFLAFRTWSKPLAEEEPTARQLLPRAGVSSVPVLLVPVATPMQVLRPQPPQPAPVNKQAFSQATTPHRFPGGFRNSVPPQDHSLLQPHSQRPSCERFVDSELALEAGPEPTASEEESDSDFSTDVQWMRAMSDEEESQLPVERTFIQFNT
eukprot:s5736_g2.t2